MIGQGGFGSVYSAWDRRLEREVAVKVIRSDRLVTPKLIERFEREAKAVAKLQHPNILTIHSVSVHAGITSMIMPRVKGESLRAYLDREGPLSTGEAFRIAAETAEGLQAAHEAGLVHRDVKPENILLEGESRRVLLSDFGIATAIHEQIAEEHGPQTGVASPALTAATTLLGTPHYVSPEQAAGGEVVGPQSDTYSLGCVLYEMLTGSPPFPGRSVESIIAGHIHKPPKPLSDFVQDISREADATVDLALQKRPGARFCTAARFATALRAFGAEEPHGPDLSRQRKTVYGVVVLVLAGGSLLLRDSPIRTNEQIHTLFESLATMLALIVGALALVRYYTRKQATFLLIGTGFLAAALLNLNHAILTTDLLGPRSGVDLEELFAWTWVSQGMFLSLFLGASMLARHGDARLGKWRAMPEGSVYATALLLAIFNMFFFGWVPLTGSHVTALPVSRPAEFLPSFFFALVLYGFLRKGGWRRDAFEHWLIVSLIISVLLHAGFMSLSAQRFDAMFAAAHALKVLSYVAVVIGLLVELFETFGSRRGQEAFSMRR